MGIVVIGNVFVDIKGFPYEKYIPAGRNSGSVMTVHGGVGRNVAENIANLELRPTFVSLVDDNAQGEEVISKLKDHKVNTDYVVKTRDGMGIWLAVFDETGDIVASISKRPDSTEMLRLIEKKGDEIFAGCDSIIIEVCLDKEIIKSVFRFAEKYNKKVFGVVANMSIAVQRRDFLQRMDCFVCNLEEAGLLFADNYESFTLPQMRDRLSENVINGRIPSMVVTMGDRGVAYADINGDKGCIPAEKVNVIDTTGAGDAFCSGLAVGLTYGKTLAESVKIGGRLASSVITVSENTCPRFLPRELGIDVEIK